jgi:hypothetical protein
MVFLSEIFSRSGITLAAEKHRNTKDLLNYAVAGGKCGLCLIEFVCLLGWLIAASTGALFGVRFGLRGVGAGTAAGTLFR